jgi:hypothetical protein
MSKNYFVLSFLVRLKHFSSKSAPMKISVQPHQILKTSSLRARVHNQRLQNPVLHQRPTQILPWKMQTWEIQRNPLNNGYTPN